MQIYLASTFLNLKSAKVKLYCLSFLLIFVAIAGCKKKKQPVTPGKSYLWTMYMGTYDVYDPVNNTQWVMKLTHLSQSNSSNRNYDSVLVENFANQFNIRDKWYPVVDSKTGRSGFLVKPYNPIYDHNGHRWNMAGRGYEASDTKIENVLLNDTIIINYDQSNIAYYTLDGVPYSDRSDVKHIAVKRH